MSSTCSNISTPLLEKNLQLFKTRFPQLFDMCHTEIETLMTQKEPDLELQTARNGMPTARRDGILLHSAYDPVREADRDIAACFPEGSTVSALVLLGIGLGYHASAAARMYPKVPLIIVEPSLHRLLSAMSVTDLSGLFSHAELMICPGLRTPAIISLIEQHDIEHCACINKTCLQGHASSYFTGLVNLIQRNKDKNSTNRRTLKKFSALWFRNMCRNTEMLAECDGITRFKDCLQGKTPAVVVAAGPTLDTQLELLAKLQETCLVICVDTALRALLRHHITPHFIILCDPQYYNARHIEGLEAPDSILITESAAYPSVFRFKCREIVLCSSMFPLGAYIERQIGSKGVLGTGGSVSASAWDFARYCGASEILLLGLDLGFPEKKTHTKGSTFEEKTFSVSNRTQPAETSLTNVLYGPLTLKKTDYSGKELLSDRRMELYAWWFESKCQEYASLRTYTGSPSSIAIPGIVPATEESLSRFSNPKNPFTAETVLTTPQDAAAMRFQRKTALQQALEQLKTYLLQLETIIRKADTMTQSPALTPSEQQKVLDALSETDRALARCAVKELLSLIFPDTEDLQSEFARITVSAEPESLIPWRTAMAQSHLIYQQVLTAIHRWQKSLF